MNSLLLFIASGEASQILEEFAVRSKKFAANVYKELLKSESHNIAVCPISAQIVLALAHAGAEGQTAQQLSAGLQLPDNPGKIQQFITELAPHLKGNERYTLSSANKIYVKRGYKVKDQFKSTAINVFDADIGIIDFAKKDDAASEINRWVESQTHDKIQNLISEDMLTDDTRAILINAMYFHGTWQYSFEESYTFKNDFHLNKNNHVKVDMMRQTDYFNFYESGELKANFLKLPYEGNGISMIFVLPNDIEDLSSLEAHIDENLLGLPNLQSRSKADVEISKFQIESIIEFNSILQALGITRAFQNNVVLQKSFIKVEEKGTTAAAATVVEMGGTSSLYVQQPEQFIANRPFYLKKNGIVFFIGRYTSPAK